VTQLIHSTTGRIQHHPAGGRRAHRASW
jgi:hypothetical protein